MYFLIETKIMKFDGEIIVVNTSGQFFLKFLFHGLNLSSV